MSYTLIHDQYSVNYVDTILSTNTDNNSTYILKSMLDFYG